ncbi:bifunctional folylpolyglutamate synthase/dihydrofolate synthase [Halalkalibacter nanhaiisediminis]|uniref:Dihydrofolate synthase/folylpolyglutamate synthase n=1 Tax=Halalkalibacter nanhaiisediminis TaxID=688079 RepID=A0A562QJZ5_9BACI|nr:dihydrofolate synthase/folylpolyglutamate synthase [Halalkalibacter nanhaiisediminis]
MFMNRAEEVIEWIHSLLPFGIKPGLKRMEWMLERLDHPERKIQTIHIGGTNGKGSTVSFMRHVLEHAGYQVGTFTSPYIECFEERISLNGNPIEADVLVECSNRIRPLVEELAQTDLGSPTEFEVITTIAFDYFANIAKPDIVLIEVGLGGRLDSTNVISPLLSIITSIGYDHMHILGETISEIAFEKAGIIKQNTTIISGVSQDEARMIIKNVAQEKNAEYMQLRIDFDEQVKSVSEQEQAFSYSVEDKELMEVVIRMQGPHQRENAAVAITALKRLEDDFHFKIGNEALLQGMAATKWIGRFEQLSNKPLMIVDGAHNKEGMESLAQTLIEHYPNKKYRFVIAATKEKDMALLLKPFQQMEATFTFTSFDFFRAADASELYNQAPVSKKRFDSNWEQAIKDERKVMEHDEMLIICGSLYFISAVREKWFKHGEAM